MKHAGFLCGLLFFCRFTTILPAAAQNPYPCDSLKLTFFDEEKIAVRFFQVPKTCGAACTFCKTIEKRDWLAVGFQLKEISKTLSHLPEPFGQLRAMLLAHRLVNFVLPPDAASPELAALQIGVQVPQMTFTQNLVLKRKEARKNKPAFWKFATFSEDSHIYARLNKKADELRLYLASDSLQMPPPLLPDQNYLAAWFGTRSLTIEERRQLEIQIKNDPRKVVAEMTAAKDGLGLVILMAHQNLAVRYLALTGIKKIQDKNCLPYLLRLIEYTINNPLQTTPETSVLYSNYCEQLVSTVGILTNSGFNRCPFAHYSAQHYLRLGLPAWERKIDFRQSQGIGSYAMPLSTN